MRKNFRRAADSPAADQSRPHWIKGQEPEAPRFRTGDGSPSPVVRACHGLSIMSWSRAFHVPITTPDGFAMRANTFRHCRERNTNSQSGRSRLKRCWRQRGQRPADVCRDCDAQGAESPSLNRHRIALGAVATARQMRCRPGWRWLHGGHFRAVQGFRYYGRQGVEG